MKKTKNVLKKINVDFNEYSFQKRTTRFIVPQPIHDFTNLGTSYWLNFYGNTPSMKTSFLISTE